MFPLLTSTGVYCLDTACEKKKYEAFYCRRNGEGKNFPEKYLMIDNVKGFRIVNQEASDIGTRF